VNNGTVEEVAAGNSGGTGFVVFNSSDGAGCRGCRGKARLRRYSMPNHKLLDSQENIKNRFSTEKDI
jgi:hypothetical protein